LVKDKGDIGKCIDECLKAALKMQEENKNVYVPQQFINPVNNGVYKNYTALEILEDIDGNIDGFCSGTGTGRTISGIGEVIKKFPDVTNLGYRA